MYALDEAIALEKTGDDLFLLRGTKLYWNFTSAYGGWICAAVVNAAEQTEGYRGELFSLSVNFISAVNADEIFLKVENVTAKRTMDFWRITGCDAQTGGKVLFTADIVSGLRRDKKLVYNASLPEFKNIEDSIKLEASPMTPVWLNAYEQYVAKGKPFSVNDNAQTVVYIKETDNRPIDARGIAALMDTPMPRPFFLQKEPTAPATLTLATHIMASAEEIAAIGDKHMHMVADCAAVNHCLFNQEARLFREDGLLIATSYQIALAP